MNQSPRNVVVVGSGVVGLSTAYYLLEKGHRVTVVERGGPDRDCCSLGNAGFVVPSHFVPLAAPGMVETGLRLLRNPEGPFGLRPVLSLDLLRWMWLFYRSGTPQHVERSAPVLRDLSTASSQIFDHWADLPEADFGLQRRGVLMVCKTEEGLRAEAKLADMAHRLGMLADVLDPAGLAKLEPDVRLNAAGGVHFPQDSFLTPRRFMEWLLGQVQQAGAEFVWSTPVEGWRTEGRKIKAARTPHGDIAGDEFVMAAGSWSARAMRSLRLQLPLQPGKGYSMKLTNPRRTPSVAMILVDARVAVTPMMDGLQFGGTMEVGGLDLRVNPARVRGIVKSIPDYMPDFKESDFQDLPVWAGLRPCSADGLPYIGRTRRWNNLSLGTGHAMMGLNLGPITGKLLAELLSDENPSLNLAPFNPDRFG